MGAAESTATFTSAAPAPSSSPPSSTSADLLSLPELQPGRPLLSLLQPTSPSFLPSDPDADIWPTLFLDYLALDSTLPFPLRPLAHSLLTSPDPPAPRLALTARACAVRLRGYVAALSSNEPAPFSPAEVLGALLFARAFLRELRAQGCSTSTLCDVLGALDGAGDIPRADRLDIGHSLLWQLIAAALDCLALPPALHTHAPRIPVAAAQLLCVALADELYAGHEHASKRNAHASNDRDDPPGEDVETLSRLVDRYPAPGTVVCALIDLVAEAAPNADAAVLLENGCEGGSAARSPAAANVAKASAISMVASGAGFANGGMGIGMAALAASASASAFNFQSGFNDALSALSARIPLRGLVGGNANGFAESAAGTERGFSVPDVDPEPYSHFSPDAASFGVRAQSPKATAASLLLNGNRSPHTSAGGRLGTIGAEGGNAAVQERYRESEKTAGDHTGKGSISNGILPDERLVADSPTSLAEHALALLCVLCGPRPANPFRKALFSIQDIPKKSQTAELAYSFSKLYEVLGMWMTHPRAALFGYYLLAGNRRFRTFTLSRTDPDVLLVPLLASMRRRCVLGSTAADAYIPAAIVLILTSDKGFCEAIDMISVPKTWLTFIEDKTRLGSEGIALSGIVLLVCARVIQQSLVLRRRMPECFLVNVCLAIMGNVSGDVTNLHSLAAERLLSLVEFLARRRKKAVLLAKHSEEMPVAPPRIGDSPRIQPKKEPSKDKLIPTDIYLSASSKVSTFEKSKAFVDRLGSFIGMSLEIVISVLRSRSVVAANRHLVYTLLHREAILDMEQVAKASVKCEALSHMLRRMIEFFSKYIDENGEPSTDGGPRRIVDANTGSTGISVERVFQIIDKNARHLPPDVFEGLPDLRFRYEELDGSEEFIRPYSWSLVTRGSEFLWNLERVAIPVQNEKFKVS